MAGQGKFDALTKELITHVLGFKEGEENFVRSEQFVLSNLLYHHCLAVNSHAVRRSIDGLALKFTVHGQHKRSKKLTDLTTRFLASPVFKDHFETDVEWSLLSVLLHLSNSPTQVPLTNTPYDSPLLTPWQQLSLDEEDEKKEEIEEEKEEEEDWAAYLKDEEDQYLVGPEEPLSDWSSEDESSDTQATTSSYSQPTKISVTKQESSLASTHPHGLMQPPNIFTQFANLPVRPPNPFTVHFDSQNNTPDPHTDSQKNKPEPHTSELPKNKLDPYKISELPNSTEGPRSIFKDPINTPKIPTTITTRESLEQLHRAKSWLSAKTHLPYWSPKCPSEASVSDHPSANVTKLWEADQGLRVGTTQQLGEWAVMREVLWALTRPTPSHIFLRDDQGTYSLRPNLSLPSLTPGASTKLLSYLCNALSQLSTLDEFTRQHECTSRHPHTAAPITLLAYATGLRCWRQRFNTHLGKLEQRVKDQESTCTLIWLEKELHLWLRTLATIHSVHCTALSTQENSTAGYLAVRVLGTLCEGVDSAGDGRVRVVLIQLLLHTLRHYLSIIHTWLLHGSLHDLTGEFIIQRDESVGVEDERFWREAFTINLQNQNLDAKDPVRTMMRFLSPLMASLTSIGKSRELLAVLETSNRSNSSIFTIDEYLTQDMKGSLEEIVVQHVIKAVSDSGKSSQLNGTLNGNEMMSSINENNGKDEKQSNEEHKKEDKEEEVRNDFIGAPDQTDPFLWAAFAGTQDSPISEKSQDMDDVSRMIEEMCNAPHAVSSVFLLSSALCPLVSKTQEQLSKKLTTCLLDHYSLEQHCQIIRAVLLMEAGDIMHEFYSHLFKKVDCGENVDGLSLTLHLQYCIARLYPELAQHFSVTIMHDEDGSQKLEGLPNDDGENTEPLLIDEVDGSGREALRRMQHRSMPSSETTVSSSTTPFNQAGLPKLYIQYQAPWPANLLLNETTMKQFNLLFNFLLSLKRVTNGLERLKFKELSGWNLVLYEGSDSHCDVDDNTGCPLPSRVHRLQLLRHWLLCFSRELHNHFANAVFMPYHCAVEKLFHSPPSLNTILTEHDKMLKKLLTECLMGSSEKILPLQIVLNKVFELTHRLSEVWVSETGSVKGSEISKLETRYACLHRYLAHFLTTFVTTRFVPHMEGLTRALVDTVPLLTQN